MTLDWIVEKQEKSILFSKIEKVFIKVILVLFDIGYFLIVIINTQAQCQV